MGEFHGDELELECEQRELREQRYDAEADEETEDWE